MTFKGPWSVGAIEDCGEPGFASTALATCGRPRPGRDDGVPPIAEVGVDSLVEQLLYVACSVAEVVGCPDAVPG